MELRKKMKTEEEECAGFPDIPMDLWIDILSRVPATPVWRLRCVCKAWRSLIQSPSFADLHLRRSQERRPTIKVTDFHERGRGGVYYYKTKFYSLVQEEEEEEGKAKAKAVLEREIVHTTAYSYSSGDISSCNGLLCYSGADYRIKVCNPITQQLITLPLTSSQKALSRFGPFGLRSIEVFICFDSSSKTHKVLAINMRDHSEFEIFTLGTTSTGCWTRVQVPVWARDFQVMGLIRTYANGCFLWSTQVFHKLLHHPDDGDQRLRAIIAFNFAQETFEYVHLPPQMVLLRSPTFWVGVVRGCLSIVFKRLKNDSTLNLWMLTNSATTQEWVWVNQDILLPFQELDQRFFGLLPFPSGELLVDGINPGRYICHEQLHHQQLVNPISLHGLPPKIWKIGVHTDSLVSIHNNNSTADKNSTALSSGFITKLLSASCRFPFSEIKDAF